MRLSEYLFFALYVGFFMNCFEGFICDSGSNFSSNLLGYMLLQFIIDLL